MKYLKKITIFAKINYYSFFCMKRIIFTLIALATLFSLSAQAPEAIRESIRKHPNLAIPTFSTYPCMPLEKVADAPKGFEPFYFSIVSRHGSRYEQHTDYFKRIVGIFHKADSLGILTAEGKRIHHKLVEILNTQKGRDGELTSLGYEQLRLIGNRAYNNFPQIFSGECSIDGRSSTSHRCVFSMVAFVQGLKENNPAIKVDQRASRCELPTIRPLVDNKERSPEYFQKHHKAFVKSGDWNKDLRMWEKAQRTPDFMSKITTDRERLLKECGGLYDFSVMHNTLKTLLFAANFSIDCSELIERNFTVEELYKVYISATYKWVCNSMSVGNDIVETRLSCMRPLVEDILERANNAIRGKNPNVADLRFTHDSYVAPIQAYMGYDSSCAQYGVDVEKAATTFNFSPMIPMGANVQFVLYRNKAGKVLVRTLINERDATMPIECKTAPFYPWDDFCNFVTKSMDRFEAPRSRVLKSLQ